LTDVQAGAISLEAFGTHLRAYLRLFHSVPNLEFIYSAPTPRLFQAAESEFYHLLYGSSHRTKSASLLDCFRVRKAWEAKERVASADVVLLKEAQVRYAARQFDEVYERWRLGGIEDSEIPKSLEQGRPPEKGAFRAMVCGSSLSVFTDPRGNSAERCQANNSKDDLPQISGSRSIEISGA
jgi:hypothetical protein